MPRKARKSGLPNAYEKVLADLVARRDEINAAIRGVEGLRGKGGFEAPPESPSRQPNGYDIPQIDLLETGPPSDPVDPDSGKARYV